MRAKIKKGTQIKVKDTSKPRWQKKTSELTDKQKDARAAEAHLFASQPSAESL